jgi:hypothetical protein
VALKVASVQESRKLETTKAGKVRALPWTAVTRQRPFDSIQGYVVRKERTRVQLPDLPSASPEHGAALAAIPNDGPSRFHCHPQPSNSGIAGPQLRAFDA